MAPSNGVKLTFFILYYGSILRTDFIQSLIRDSSFLVRITTDNGTLLISFFFFCITILSCKVLQAGFHPRSGQSLVFSISLYSGGETSDILFKSSENSLYCNLFNIWFLNHNMPLSPGPPT